MDMRITVMLAGLGVLALAGCMTTQDQQRADFDTCAAQFGAMGNAYVQQCWQQLRAERQARQQRSLSQMALGLQMMQQPQVQQTQPTTCFAQGPYLNCY